MTELTLTGEGTGTHAHCGGSTAIFQATPPPLPGATDVVAPGGQFAALARQIKADPLLAACTETFLDPTHDDERHGFVPPPDGRSGLAASTGRVFIDNLTADKCYIVYMTVQNENQWHSTGLPDPPYGHGPKIVVHRFSSGGVYEHSTVFGYQAQGTAAGTATYSQLPSLQAFGDVMEGSKAAVCGALKLVESSGSVESTADAAEVFEMNNTLEDGLQAGSFSDAKSRLTAVLYGGATVRFYDREVDIMTYDTQDVDDPACYTPAIAVVTPTAASGKTFALYAGWNAYITGGAMRSTTSTLLPALSGNYSPNAPAVQAWADAHRFTGPHSFKWLKEFRQVLHSAAELSGPLAGVVDAGAAVAAAAAPASAPAAASAAAIATAVAAALKAADGVEQAEARARRRKGKGKAKRRQ